ncbi:MAG: hypothetical protein Ct9H300mP14_02950 [Gammaproteobacteria bacterium]|nr:MAG: hypothetical protein Ct9H300mP14_02950 [Gammaproteobacteria bacterium]
MWQSARKNWNATRILEIERQEAFARANQDKAVSNEQALRVGEKQRYVLEQKIAVEEKEIHKSNT